MIFVRHIVDQPRAQRDFRQKRTLVEQRPDLGILLLPAVGDAADNLLVQVPVERFVHFPVRRGKALLREHVRRGLVVADVVQIRIRADLVQRAAEEQLVRSDAGQIERARRHEEDLVCGTGEIVVAVGAVLEIRIDRLA